jgi:hypothetical protein
MRNGKGQGGPATSPSKSHQATWLDAELLELERRKLIAYRGGGIVLTREGYLEISRRFPRHTARRRS